MFSEIPPNFSTIKTYKALHTVHKHNAKTPPSSPALRCGFLSTIFTAHFRSVILLGNTTSKPGGFHEPREPLRSSRTRHHTSISLNYYNVCYAFTRRIWIFYDNPQGQDPLSSFVFHQTTLLHDSTTVAALDYSLMSS